MSGYGRRLEVHCAQKEDAWPDPTGTQLYEGGCFHPQQLAELVQIMLAHGYPPEAVRGILEVLQTDLCAG